MKKTTQYEIAHAIGSDLAEQYMAANISEMMIEGGARMAKEIRALSEANTNQGDKSVQEYRSIQRAMYSAVWKMLDGHGGYRLLPNAKIRDDQP